MQWTDRRTKAMLIVPSLWGHNNNKSTKDTVYDANTTAQPLQELTQIIC